MGKLIRNFVKFPFFVQLVWLLCVIGALTNAVLLVRDVTDGGLLFRLHLAYFILYAGQVFFIVAREKWVALLTLLQGIIALLTTVDFIFVPLLQVMGRTYYGLFHPTVEQLKVYQYVFTSIAFTLQMATAAYLWGYLYKKGEPK